MHKLNQDRLFDKLDLGIVIFTCAMVFSLPISIAMVESFSGFVILFFVMKKYFQASFSLQSASLNEKPPILRREFFWRTFRKSLILPKHPLRIPLLILMLVFFLTVIVSHDRVSSLVAYFGKFLQGVALMLSIHEGFKKGSHLFWVAGVFISSVILVSLSGVTQLYFGYEFIRGNAIAADMRISSSLRHANDLGIFLVIGLGVVLAVLHTSVSYCNKRLKVFLLCVIAIVLFVLMHTYSRSSWLGLLVFMGLACLLDRKFIKFAVGFGVVIFLIFVPALNKSRNVTMFSDNLATKTDVSIKTTTSIDKSPFASRIDDLTGDSIIDKVLIQLTKMGGAGRSEYWEKAVKVIQTAPVLGTGLNTYSKQVEKIPGFWGGGYAHNCYLQMTAETGLMGISAFMYFIISLFCFGIKSCSLLENKEIKAVLSLLICSLLGYLTQSFFDTTFYSVQLGIMLWILSGFILAVPRIEPKLTNQKP